MSDEPEGSSAEFPGFDGSFEGARRRQVLLGLGLEPAERLRWLERTMAELRSLQGRARIPEPPPG
ncbi:MAG: hypothetical protein ABI837_12865 [Acidobacteriota bacterium]